MEIVEPKVEIITETDPLKRIEFCGRVCYQSQAKITDTSSYRFVARLIRSGHTSVLEHSRIEVPITDKVGWLSINNRTTYSPYGFYNRVVVSDDDETVTMNVRDYLAFGGDLDTIVAKNYSNATDYMTVRFITDRAIANELVRHRVFSFSQESTRYVTYAQGITVVEPLPLSWAGGDYGDRYNSWIECIENAERGYIKLISLGIPPEEARTVLPLSTKTELIMTGTKSQWNVLISLRIATNAHPQIRFLMQELVKQMENQDASK